MQKQHPYHFGSFDELELRKLAKHTKHLLRTAKDYCQTCESAGEVLEPSYDDDGNFVSVTFVPCPDCS